MKHPSLFTIAASAPFAETLARGLIARAGDDPLALSSAIIYLPTRRAARSFGDAFAKVMGGAALLPQFRPLGDSEEDELLFDAASGGLELAPAIAPLASILLAAWSANGTGGRGGLVFSESAALRTAGPVMDEVETRAASSKLKDWRPPPCRHWEGVSRFGIAASHGPRFWRAKTPTNPAARSSRVSGADPAPSCRHPIVLPPDRPLYSAHAELLRPLHACRKARWC